MQANQIKREVSDVLATVPGATIEQLEEQIVKATTIQCSEEEAGMSCKASQMAMGWANENVVMTRVEPFAEWFNKPTGKFVAKEKIDEFLAKYPSVPGRDGAKAAGPYVRTSPQRPEVDFIGWEPDKEPLVSYNEGARVYYNSFKGLGIAPVAGDTEPFDWLLDAVVQEEPEHLKWLEQWCAYPLQNLGEKLITAVVLHGITQGTGKSLFGHVTGSAYGGIGTGENEGKGLFKEVDQKTLHAPFNGWSAHRLFILCDEISSPDKRVDADFLKGIITRKTADVNEKYQPVYTIRDHANYVFTSNANNAIYIERPDDRRWAVFHMPTKMGERGRLAYEWWLDPASGPALLDRLLKVDLTGFDPSADAPQTEARRRMHEAGRSDVDSWAFDVFLSPDAILSMGSNGGKEVPDLWSIQDLVAVYGLTHAQGTKRIVLGNSLTKAGVYKTLRVVTKVGEIELYAVRNGDRYKNMGRKEIAAAYDKGVKTVKYAG
jgi:hypothetical protein